MTLSFDRLTFQLSNSEDQIRNLSDVALSTLFNNPFGSFLVDLLFKSTLDLIDDLDLNKTRHFRCIYMYAYLSVLIFPILFANINDTLEKMA